MSIIPAFEIGLWNAWTIMVLFILTAVVPGQINKEASARAMGKWKDYSRTEKIVMIITHGLIMPGLIIYSIFLPLKLGTLWLYAGLLLCSLGLALSFQAGIDFATTPLDKLVTKGAYRISRHPIYFGAFLVFAGTGLACASWVFLLCAAAWIISFQFGVKEEERFLLKQYGNAYREYMEKTPRWIGIK
jgi:protein-S-isoprenylcysteine O-methyltransferase Ste14